MAEININNLDVVRAWKDEEYRNSLTEEQRSQLPNNPAGLIDLSGEEMKNVSGGGFTSDCWGRTRGCWLGTKDPACYVATATIIVVTVV